MIFIKKNRIALGIVVGCLAVLVLTGIVFFAKSFQEDNTTPWQAPDNSGAEAEPSPLSDVVNVLLVGTDHPDEGESFSRSDAIMIASLNPFDQTVQLISILRDTYVDVPGHGGSRLNEAHSAGGTELLLETINHNFALDLQYYVEVDFGGFTEVVDLLGGVEIPVTDAESFHVFGETKPAGTYQLNGEQTLDYCRIRKIDSDFNRTARQRNVLYAMYEKFQSQEDKLLFQLLRKVYPMIETNMDISGMMTLYRQYRMLEDVSLAQMHLPVDGGFEEKSVYGQDVLLIDLPKNIAALHRTLYGEDAVIPPTPDLPEIPEGALGDPSWLAKQKQAQQQPMPPFGAEAEAEADEYADPSDFDVDRVWPPPEDDVDRVWPPPENEDTSRQAPPPPDEQTTP